MLTSTRLQQHAVGIRWLSASLVYILTAVMTGYNILLVNHQILQQTSVELVFLLLHWLCLQQLLVC